MPGYSILYSKKDVLVKNYLEASGDVTSSNMVELAIEYYIKTRQYLPLGQVGTVDEHPDKKTKCVYFSQNSIVNDYIQQMRNEKISAKTIICDVINNGVTLGEKTERITMQSYLIAKKSVQSGSGIDGSNSATVKTMTTSMPPVSRPPLEEKQVKRSQVAQNTKYARNSSDDRVHLETERSRNDDMPQVDPSEDITVPPKREKKRITFGDQFIQNKF